ncbi:MAG: tRNA threonylcarbamoyladenosine dehydratase, partial [Clostridia bacterium]|nr:tRNA threonylcarbamoyladenosine dehydratase [Clostridia bacterium]
MERFCRTELVLGREAMERLKSASVAVFGIGGVGSYAAEALARSGVGRLMLVDDDTVAESNINRQLIALTSTVGRQKALVMRDRALDINPDINIDARPVRFDESTVSQFDFFGYDYIVDAIDSVTSKILLIERAKAAGVPIICSMGTGNKLHPECFCIEDISKTTVCPLARVVRRELKKRGIEGVKVLYSKEPAIAPKEESDEELLPGKHRITGSVAFVPSVAGLMLAGEVIRHIA